MKINKAIMVGIIFLAIALTVSAYTFGNKQDARQKKDDLKGMQITQGKIQIMEVTELLDISVNVIYRYNFIVEDNGKIIKNETVENNFDFSLGGYDLNSKDGEIYVMEKISLHAQNSFNTRKSNFLNEVYVNYDNFKELEP